ncbi:MAG: vitamin B12 dependent-methionine synthase activation domain-containing protein, partial [Cyclobacteriaceae bacterium]
SKSVPVVGKLMGQQSQHEFQSEVKAQYQQLREDHAGRKKVKNYISIGQARANKVKIDWNNFEPAVPSFLGNKVFKDFDLKEISKYIDWTPFFQTWMLKGKFPKILEDATIGKEATKLYKDANGLLDKIVSEELLFARAIVGLYPANSIGDDDVVVYLDESRTEPLKVFHFLRQQGKKGEGLPNICLADFVAPRGKKEYLGGFAVTAGIGIESLIEQFDRENDDYLSIMVKALADRLAEAFAELMHEKVRKDLWGYAAAETWSNQELIAEKYHGIRPAPGYPACPDHTEKRSLFDLLEVEAHTGISLTESFAMYPAASVSGFYFSHPESKYFGLGKVEKDQVEDYASRKAMDLAIIEKWLSPNLSYESV